MPDKITIDDALSAKSNSVVDSTYAAYPGLRRYGVHIKESPSGKDWRGQPYSGRKMEFYPPDESYNPNPGKPTVELFSRNVGPDDIMGEIFSHYLPEVDNEFRAARERFVSSIDQRQKDILRGDYQHQLRSGVFGEKKPTFDQWLSGVGGDAFFRGYVANQYPKEFYRQDQVAMFEPLVAKLKTADTAITFDDAIADRESGLRPGGRLEARPGEMPTPGQGLPGSPNYRPPMIGKRPEAADASNFGTAFKSEVVSDPGARKRLVAESIGVSEDRVGEVGGRPVFVNDEGKLQYVSGPWSNFSATVLANAPETIGGVVGSFAAGHPILGASAGAAGGKALKRGLSQLILDEPATPGSVAAEMAMEGVAEVAGGALGKGAAAVLNKGKIVDFSMTVDLKNAEQARDFVKQKLDIDLDLAQASGNRKLLALRDYAATYPGKTAEVVQAADEINEGKLDVATNRVLDLVAKSEPSMISGQRGVNAASAAIEAARESVYKAVDPLYKAAYRAVPEVTDEKILKMLELPRFPQAMKKAREMLELETGEKLAKDAPVSLQLLDNVKRALDDQIGELKDSGSRQLAGMLQQRRNDFVAAIDALPNQQWQLARKRYAELIERGVAPMEKGIVGVLAGIKDENAATAAAKIFSDPNISADEIRYAKTKINQQDPEAWNGLVRQWLGQRWNASLKETQGADVTNPAGKFRQAVFGTPDDKRKIQVLLPPGAAADFEALMFAMEKLAKTPLGASRIAGSPTETRRLISEALEGRVSMLANILRPREAVLTAAEERARDQGIEAITEALFDPTKRSQLKQIVKMKPSTRQAILIGGLLAGQAGKEAISDLLATDQVPESR